MNANQDIMKRNIEKGNFQKKKKKKDGRQEEDNEDDEHVITHALFAMGRPCAFSLRSAAPQSPLLRREY